jgi:predicted Zn-dependent peptidase
MKKLSFLSSLLLLIAVAMMTSCASKPTYTTVPNDPLKARIYTLDNGLKVYMTVNKETPRIQTFIAVRVGGKNDPAETTGLAHYFEHLMFKGTKDFGTQNYEAEKPLLDAIEQQFEVYRQTKDSVARKAIYHVIDSLSYEASKLAIPNEYDKLMAAIGANGTNAYTSFDVTCYTEDIPSNEVDNWAKIQADRFKNNVIRGFHTELETVYEEKNMSLTRDPRKVYEAVFSSLFPHHPYGTQTVLGTQEDLKNPSITNIKNYYKEWYVPNNMAICLSGDFDPDKVIEIIQRNFGDMQPNPNLPVLQLTKEEPITKPIVREVLGLDAENISLAWRYPGAANADGTVNKDAEVMSVVSNILYNGQAGLLDLDVNQQQKALGVYAYTYGMADYGAFMMAGQPKQGQTLDEVKDLLLAEVKKLRDGDFDQSLLESIINNYKLNIMQNTERNRNRADWFVDAFVNGMNWGDAVSILDRVSKLTKEDIVAFANNYLKDDNYAVIYKRQGKDPNEMKIAKPQITPIVMNRDTVSNFLKGIQMDKVTPIEPVFLDYNKDMQVLSAKEDIPVLYKQNTSNDLFQLVYLFDMGSNNDKELASAATYLDYLGTADMTPEAIKREFFRLACSFSVSPGSKRTYVTLSGLNENMPAAVQLFETLMANAVVNKEAWSNLTNDILKARADAKLNQSTNFSRLVSYAMYGPKSPATNLLTEREMKSMNPQTLVDKVKGLNGYKHRILYYGPSTGEELLQVINTEHQIPAALKEYPAAVEFPMLKTTETKIYIAPYQARQIYMSQISNRGELYSADEEPIRQLYNEYFGGGMNSIVFQEMRESRGLAYSAAAFFVAPTYKEDPYYMRTQIATQNDKMIDAIDTFNDIINNMPVSDAAFKLAKEGMMARLRTERLTKMNILWSYISAQYLGETTDIRSKVYNDIQNMELDDVIAFQEKWIKARPYTYAILGDKKDLDMEALRKIAPVVELTKEDIFGF